MDGHGAIAVVHDKIVQDQGLGMEKPTTTKQKYGTANDNPPHAGKKAGARESEQTPQRMQPCTHHIKILHPDNFDNLTTFSYPKRS
jgi:hypothetical protein